MSHPKSRFLFICVAMLALSMSGFSQDTHYWNLQYGTRSTLLGGAVIGSVEDLGATFYNPGFLGLTPNPEFLLSARVYQLTLLNLKDGIAKGVDLNSSKLEPEPSLLAGSFNIPSLKGHRFGYSILNRQRAKFSIEARGTIQAEPGDSSASFAGEFLFDQNLKDIWTGLTWSYRLNERVGIGVTQYVVVRDQKIRQQTVFQSLTGSNSVATSFVLDQFDYKHIRLLWKAGAGFDFDALTLGITLTTPSISLFGWGSSFLDALSTGGNGNTPPVYAVEIEKDLNATYRSPLSVGAGASYKVGRTRLHASAEWFDAVKKFTVMETKDLQDQVSGASIPTSLTHELKSIVNYGFGAEIAISKRFQGYGSFVTDFSAAVPGTDTNLAISTWNIYHLTGGASFLIGTSEITFGINYAFGSDDIQRPIDLAADDNSGQEADSNNQIKFSYNRIKAIFGFSFQI